MSTDVLSDVLSAVRLSGSVFFDITAKSPWVAEAPPAAQIADDVMPGAQHVIEYHVVTRGQCWITLVGDTAFEPVSLSEGDIAVMPQGDPTWSRVRRACVPSLIWKRTAGRRTPTHCLSQLKAEAMARVTPI
jgi:hypothetical protein